MELPEVNINGSSGASKLPLKKIIFIAVILIIVGEVIWAGWSIYSSINSKTNGQIGLNNDQFTDGGEILATISLQSTKTDFNVGEVIPVNILISSVRPTDGTDLIIHYDPQLVAVDTSNGSDPVIAGLIYSDYPLNRLDAVNNLIYFSGISSSLEGIQANGILGTINFTALSPGKAKIWIEYTRGNTTDSNVVENGTSKDILGKVEDLEVNIK